MKKFYTFIFRARKLKKFIEKNPLQGFFLLFSTIVLILAFFGLLHTNINFTIGLILNIFGLSLIFLYFFLQKFPLPYKNFYILVLILALVHLTGGFKGKFCGFLYFPLLLLFLSSPSILLTSGILISLTHLSSALFKNSNLIRDGFPAFTGFILYFILFYLISRNWNLQFRNIKKRLEDLSSKLKLYNGIILTKEESLKGLKEMPLPKEPYLLFKRALVQITEIYKNILKPRSIAFMFYDKETRGFRPESAYSIEKSFIKKGIVPEDSPLLQLAIKQKRGFYFEEWTGSTLDTGLYSEPDVRIGSCVIEPIFHENALYGFFYSDSEKIGFFSSNVEKIAQEISKEISVLLQFFFEAKENRILSHRFRALFELVRETGGTLRKKEIFPKIKESVSHIITYDLFFIVEKKEEDFGEIVALDDPKKLIRDTVVQLNQDSLVSFTFQSGFPILVGRIGKNIPVINNDNFSMRSGLFFPVKTQGEVNYVFSLLSYSPGNFTEQDKEIMNLLCHQSGVVLEKASLFEKEQELAKRDGLTGLYNHRMFHELLETTILKERPFVLVIIDVDHFKKLNDEYGHPFGDIVLKGIAKILKEHTLDSGFCARYGGEEFSLCFDGSKEEGIRKAESIRKSIQEWNFYTEQGEKASVTVSCGVSAFPEDGKTRATLIEKADRALYLAKRKGRNQVRKYSIEETGLF